MNHPVRHHRVEVQAFMHTRHFSVCISYGVNNTVIISSGENEKPRRLQAAVKLQRQLPLANIRSYLASAFVAKPDRSSATGKTEL